MVKVETKNQDIKACTLTSGDILLIPTYPTDKMFLQKMAGSNISCQFVGNNLRLRMEKRKIDEHKDKDNDVNVHETVKEVPCNNEKRPRGRPRKPK